MKYIFLGNAIFVDAIPQLPDRIKNTEERNGNVMMNRIKSHSSRNVVVKPLRPVERVNVVGESGIFGDLLG